MGGHGGLNILPQKRWNVYNYDNREKVRQDEEAAAKEEQLKREQARKRDTEFRLEQLRTARGLAPLIRPAESATKPEEPATTPAEAVTELDESQPKSGHINLFEGIKIFDPIKVLESKGGVNQDEPKKKKMKKEEVRVVTEEDEKYRLGYGVAGKGVKLPWYLEKKSDDFNDERGGVDKSSSGRKDDDKKSGKKTLEQLREERLKREKQEKERERALILKKTGRDEPVLRDRYYRR
ncbi:hypothetical protein HS088_TW20G00222 [Tripterygium wilfordii]|uniref:CBF1-interacting co-repressor CIR N-terminal domain-containing protein n=1 Tax=Tripterygium wilfordii TaxID=458696 RepID=A0A7J7C7P0_TRIWF|nr:leukocyte receptor cluster member 1 homolog [Tripterygium wilfordii]KAF5729857.1 hypothetical protein HS088_TW20G00222 [Tripterygium wilfordii]